MAVPVHFAARDTKGRITHLGGVGPQSTSWQLTAAEVIRAIESGEWLFLTQGPEDLIARVEVRRNSNIPNPWLVSVPDQTTVNNLDRLPTLVSPMGGAWPTSPMNFPSIVSTGAMSIQRATVRLGRNRNEDRQVRASVRVGAYGLLPLIDMTGADRSGTRLTIDIKLPFPAVYFVNVLGDNGAIANLILSGRGRDGWFTWNAGPTFFDNGGPSRIPEIRLLCALPRWAWEQPAFTIEIGYISLNPYARELLRSTPVGSRLIRFANLGQALGPPPSAPPDVVMPNCVGQTLSAAMVQVEAVGLRAQSFAADLLDGLPHISWQVTAQAPATGSSLPRGRVVQLYARPTGSAQTPPGVKTVRIYNQYQQRRPLHVWNRDITSGSWKDEGEADFSGAPVSVDLVDGHVHALFYADYSLNSCRPDPSFPPDLCVYKGPDGPVRGDDNGSTVDVIVS